MKRYWDEHYAGGYLQWQIHSKLIVGSAALPYVWIGIATQERGIENSGCFDLTVICTSEIDKDAIISYAAIHKGLTPEMVKEYPDYPSLKEMKAELAKKNIVWTPAGWPAG